MRARRPRDARCVRKQSQGLEPGAGPYAALPTTAHR